MLYLGANFVLVTGVLRASQAELGAGAFYLGWAAQGDPGLSSRCCLREGEACTAPSSPLDLSLLHTSLWAALLVYF